MKSSLSLFGNQFYTYNATTQKWVKDVPKKLETFLTPTALACFYMDDGALKWLGKSNSMLSSTRTICTESFSLEGVERLKKALEKLYNIKTKLSKKTLKDGKIGYRIEIPEASSRAFTELISPFLVDPMQYKVSDGNCGHLGTVV